MTETESKLFDELHEQYEINVQLKNRISELEGWISEAVEIMTNEQLRKWKEICS